MPRYKVSIVFEVNADIHSDYIQEEAERLVSLIEVDPDMGDWTYEGTTVEMVWN